MHFGCLLVAAGRMAGLPNRVPSWEPKYRPTVSCQRVASMVSKGAHSCHSTDAMVPFSRPHPRPREAGMSSLGGTYVVTAEVPEEAIIIVGVEQGGNFEVDMWDQPEVTMSVMWFAPLPAFVFAPGAVSVSLVALSEYCVSSRQCCAPQHCYVFHCISESDLRQQVVHLLPFHLLPNGDRAHEAPTAPFSCPSIAISATSLGVALSSLAGGRSNRRSRKAGDPGAEAAVSTRPSPPSRMGRCFAQRFWAEHTLPPAETGVGLGFVQAGQLCDSSPFPREDWGWRCT